MNTLSLGTVAVFSLDNVFIYAHCLNANVDHHSHEEIGS